MGGLGEAIMDIGFIGLGHMGSGVAGSLLGAGHRLKVWNRSPGPAQALAEKGAEVAESPAAACNSQVVFSMLADDPAIEAVILESGALDAAPRGLIHVNLATISVAFAQRLEAEHARRGLAYVAAPVLGRPDLAAKGQLNVLCAGAADPVQEVWPLLDTFAARVWPLGEEPHRANVVKLACNFALASMIETLGEAGALAAAHGVAPKDLYEVMTGSVFASPAYKTYAELIAQGRFEPSFKLPLGLKDIRLALAAGEAKHAALPVASMLRDHFIEAIAQGDGDKDWAALAAGAFRRAGVPLDGGASGR